MESAKSLRRPVNWQDFESLCKKLWGEIWNCPEIKKNGRSGQNQHGVDIYGVPQDDTQYYGIQCKGKDEYSHSQFTEHEIEIEINNAINFKPELKKFYLATTAVKDVKIEEFVRRKNLENISKGLFEIHLFSWEDIVDLIDENKQTHNWYVKNQNYKTQKSVSVTFQNDETEINALVPFRQKIIEYKLREAPKEVIKVSGDFDQILASLKQFQNPQIKIDLNQFHSPLYGLYNNRKNHSLFKFCLKLHNTGVDPIEDFKILLTFEGEFQALSTVPKGNWITGIRLAEPYDTFVDEKEKTGKIVSLKKILVGDDSTRFDYIRIKPLHEPSKVLINWKLISKDFKDDGKLKLNFIPEIKKEMTTLLVDEPSQVRTEEGKIEDFITDIKPEK